MKIKPLSEILMPILGNKLQEYKNIMIQNISYDSRKITDDSLFVAIEGFQVDGHKYLSKAEENGAKAAIVEKISAGITIPQIKVQNSRQSMAQVVKQFYIPDLSKIKTVGITGTNGKTTTTYLVKSILECAGMSSGLIGTIEYEINNEKISSWNTTPESSDLCDMIYKMQENGQKACVMEVSSHGIALNRVDCIDFEVAVFMNLSHDHLDFHKDIEDYFSAKNKLFNLLKPNGVAVINSDDEYGNRIIEKLKNEYISFGLNSDAKVSANKWNSNLEGLSIEVKTQIGDFLIESPLIGQFNVENILAAVSVGLAFNIDLNTIKIGIEKIARIPGRLEPIKLKNNKVAVVDYSHTPDALQKALIELKKIKKNQLWIVFGCGGDRDKGKRPVMGKIAEDYASKVIITSDNPRSENPKSIIDDILEGITKKDSIIVESDRRAAIDFTLKNSESEDIILVAGKGHETYQEINGIKYDFDDRQIIQELDK